MPANVDPGRVLAIVLARGGSKGIPSKNLRTVGGVPLLGRAIETLRQVEAIDRVVVSTDCSELASLALAYGADIPFFRPAALASDDSSSLAALEHAVRWLCNDGERAATTLLYQATSPCCRPEQVSGAIEAFHRSGAPLLKSVAPASEHPHWMGRVEDGRLHYLHPSDERATRRQDLPPLYRLNGAISIYRTSRILGGVAEQGDPAAFIMDRESSLDIDRLTDLEQAERQLA